MKTILLDADGVTLKKQGYFSERYAREYNVPAEDITPFFKNEFRVCQQGKADLKDELKKYLPKWKWDKTTDEFLEYWFTSDSIADEEVFAIVEHLRNRGFKCYLVTDQEKYRARYLREELNFKESLDDCFFSCDLGFQKSQPGFFESVLKTLNTEASGVLYWDDEIKNIEIAKALGIDARLFTGIREFERDIENLG